nr:MAG TPA: hypothetical protein [Bacteriophage sp.]
MQMDKAVQRMYCVMHIGLADMTRRGDKVCVM